MNEIAKLLKKWRKNAYPYTLNIEIGNDSWKIITVILNDGKQKMVREMSDELIEDADYDVISNAIDMCKIHLERWNVSE